MAEEIGIVMVAAAPPTRRQLVETARSVWQAPPTGASIWSIAAPVPLEDLCGLSGPVTALVFLASSASVAAARRLDDLACELSSVLGAQAAAVFITSKGERGGYRLFDFGCPVGGEDVDGEVHVDGPRRGLAAMCAAPIDLNRCERLFFAEDICSMVLADGRHHLLARDGEWVGLSSLPGIARMLPAPACFTRVGALERLPVIDGAAVQAAAASRDQSELGVTRLSSLKPNR